MKNTQSIADFPIRERIYYDVSSRIITVPMQKRLKVSMTANISDFTWPTATSHVTFTSWSTHTVQNASTVGHLLLQRNVFFSNFMAHTT